MQLYTPSEVAKLLQVSRQTVHNMLNCGVLPSVDISAVPSSQRRARRIREDDFVAFLEARRTRTQGTKTWPSI